MPHGWKVYEGRYPHFITCSVLHLIPVFRRADYFRILTGSLRHCIAQRGLLVHAFVIMPDHFHMICSQIAGDVSSVLRDIKRFTSGELTRLLAENDAYAPWLRAMRRAAAQGSEFRLWDDGFHPEEVRSEQFFRQKCDYIHANPVKADYVEDPSHWKHSSARFYYENLEATVPIEPIDW